MSDVRGVQIKILETMKFIDHICRKNKIEYYIMGGTALGAVRHGGFIPWDDDLDIFMTPEAYEKFKTVFNALKNDKFVLQEWKTVEKYLEYAKVRMNGTTFIEECFKDRHDMHHGIYVDIMILHKVPKRKFTQKVVYYASKFVTLYGISQRNWKPKTKTQRIVLAFTKLLPRQIIAKWCYRQIYKYDSMTDNFQYCYWITPAKFSQGLFNANFFTEPIDISFEDTQLLGSRYIKDYLKYRYGDYMKLPSIEQQNASVHAMVYDTCRHYTEFLK